MNRQERRRLLAISRKYRGLQASSFAAESAMRARASEELEPARLERSRKLRALGFLGLLVLVFSALACAGKPATPEPERFDSVEFARCMRAEAGDAFCSCYAKNFDFFPGRPTDQKRIEMMDSCSRERVIHGFKSLHDLFADARPLEPADPI